MIKAVAKAIDILEVFGPTEPRLSLGEIARRLDLPKSTAHNLLATLAVYGLIEKTDDNQYALGTTLITMTQAVRVNIELRDRAAPLLRQLADECRETVYLTALDHDHALYIYAIESPARLLARSAIGDRVPLHCTSVGKAILSGLSAEQVDEIVERVGLPAFTKNTITELPALHAELEETRARGYAIDCEEHELNTYCIGAPIYDAHGLVVGACSISSRSQAILQERLDTLAPLILSTGHEISRRMGYVPSRVSSLPRSLIMDRANQQ